MKKLIAIGIVTVALLTTGCAGGNSHPHPANEFHQMQEQAHATCSYGRAEAEAHGAKAEEIYNLECE
jgi:hypothetical protein